MKYKKWSLAEKLEILASSEELGIVETCRKYSVSTAPFTVGRRSMKLREKQGLKSLMTPAVKS